MLHSLRIAAQSRTSRLDSTSYVPITLHPTQQAFYDDDRLEILYGGAAGGGKTFSQLAAALKYVHVPGYSALLIRRAYTDLSMAGAFIPVSREWLRGTEAVYDQSTHRWRFPSGATLTFGYLDHDRHLDRYQGSAFQFIGIDEATQIPSNRYRYLFSRLRKPDYLEVPLRFRATANPGGVGHEFIKQRFLIEGEAAGRRFIPAKLSDNPSLDQASYLRSLSELDPLTRQRLLNGDWDAIPQGGMFRREWFEGKIVEPSAVPKGIRWLRFWDRASTEVKPGTDPDWTAGALVALRQGQWYIRDLVHFRADSAVNEQRVRETSDADGFAVPVYMEMEPGSSGKDVISHYARNVMPGRTFRGVRATGSKTERAAPLASAAEQGNVFLVRGPWVTGFLDELCAFPLGTHDDRVDAVSGALGVINQRARSVKSVKVAGL